MATIVAKFIRHLSVDDIHQYFKFRHIESGDFDWQAKNKNLQKSLIALINDLPDLERTTIFIDAEAIIELADEAGHLAMLDATHDRVALQEVFDKIESAEGRALWLFINDAEAFRRAGLIRRCDQLHASRSWNGYIAPAGAELGLSSERVSALARACADIYRERYGFRGSFEVEFFDRLVSWRDGDGAGSVVQITIYTEDRPLSLMQFEGDILQTQRYRPASEAHVTYCAADRAIDVAAKGGQSIRMKIAGLFAKHLLGVDCDLEPVTMRKIDLSGLVDRGALAVKAGGSIAHVDLKFVRFQPLDGSSHYKIFGRRGHSIYDDLEGGKLGVPGYEIDRSELIFEFFPEAGQRQGTRVAVTLTCPNGCSVKDKGQRHRPAIEEFLDRSGICRAIDLGNDTQFEAAD